METWREFFNKELSKAYFTQLTQFIQSEREVYTVFPIESQVFAAFDSCPLHTIKVVILGQDPYPTKGHAHGLSFSVQSDVKPLPKSLVNIFRELNDDLKIEIPTNGNLERWAKQGVFLLNTVLTVREGVPQSHTGKGWEIFTDNVIELLNSQSRSILFLLWGSKAQNKKQMIDSERHLILEAPHPSPLSVYRGFYGCKHFSKVNQYLIQRNLQPIVW
jgi:uracil-DNA glycosylase